MLDEEDFKNKYLQQPITFLTEENLDILETHCRRAVNFEKGFEHKVVLELLERYYQFQKEIQDKNNRITKLQKENEELKQENKRIKYFSSNLFIDDYIPKKVIKDKIKEIEEDKECYYYDCFLEELDIEKTINILEELLGDE
jgi:hypothetical protein